MKRLILSTALPGWLAMQGTLGAQHAHINAGAFSTAQDAKLYFVNGDGFVTNSGYLVNLTYTNSGQYAGSYQGSMSFTALPATGNLGGPAFGHAALGAYLHLQVESLAGPDGGSFGFWEETDASPRFSVPVGETQGTNRFDLTESDSAPGSDPFGHIHGRGFTATMPGLYTVGFRIHDTSSNGTNGGPIHTPSDLFQLYFQAGLTISSLALGTNVVQVTFGAQPRKNFYLEAADALVDSTTWTTVAGPLIGVNRLSTLDHTGEAGTTRFYRIRAENP